MIDIFLECLWKNLEELKNKSVQNNLALFTKHALYVDQLLMKKCNFTL